MHPQPDPAEALADLLLVDLGPECEPQALARRLFGRVHVVPRVAVGAGAAMIERGPWPLLLVAEDARPGEAVEACAWFVAREWLRARSVDRVAATAAAEDLARALLARAGAPVSAIVPLVSVG